MAGEKRRENHKCPSCNQDYPLRIEENFVSDENGKSFYFEDLMSGVSGFHQTNKCFWDSPITKQKIQNYRNKFNKYFDYKDGGRPSSMLLKPKPNLTLTQLEQVKKEILAVPFVDVCVLSEALIPRKFEQEIGTAHGTRNDKKQIIRQIQERINQLSKPQKPTNNKCEKCQTHSQQIQLTEEIKGNTKIMMVCQQCALEYTKCEGCQKTGDINQLGEWQKGLTVIKKNGQKIKVCQQCKGQDQDDNSSKCEACQREMKEGEQLFLANDNQGNQINICSECFKKNKPTDRGEEPNKDDKNKPNDKNRKPNPNECCEKCGVSCIVHQTKTSYTWKRKRYIKHKTDFTRENSCWFGLNCSCAKEFREANQQTCPHCKKREFPHMKRGWMLDYEIKKAFCSASCHVAYRELKWEEAERLTQIEMFPPELDVSVNPEQNTDWEKEGLKREVLYWREYARELEQRLNNQTNLTPQEQQQSNYLRRLQQNTLQRAEQAYQSQYGSLSEDGSNKNKGMSGGVIALLVIGGIVLIGGIIFLLTRNKNKNK